MTSRARRQVETLFVEPETKALVIDAMLTVSKVKLLLVRGGERRIEVSVRFRMVDKFDENALSWHWLQFASGEMGSDRSSHPVMIDRLEPSLNRFRWDKPTCSNWTAPRVWMPLRRST